MLFIHRTSDDLLSIWDEMPSGTLVVQSGPLGIRPSVILIIGGVLKWSSRFSSLLNDRYHFGSRLAPTVVKPSRDQKRTYHHWGIRTDLETRIWTEGCSVATQVNPPLYAVGSLRARVGTKGIQVERIELLCAIKGSRDPPLQVGGCVLGILDGPE